MWKKIGIAVIAVIAVIVGWLPVGGFAAGLSADQALEPSSEIEGLLEGEPREWFILSHGNDSNASFVELGDDINIDITGFVDKQVWEAQEALSISLTVRDEQLINAVVIHPLGVSISPPLYTSEGGEVAVTLTHYERASQMVHVAGTIQGVLALQVELGEPPSREEAIEIDVKFDVEAQKIEF